MKLLDTENPWHKFARLPHYLLATWNFHSGFVKVNSKTPVHSSFGDVKDPQAVKIILSASQRRALSPVKRWRVKPHDQSISAWGQGWTLLQHPSCSHRPQISISAALCREKQPSFSMPLRMLCIRGSEFGALSEIGGLLRLPFFNAGKVAPPLFIISSTVFLGLCMWRNQNIPTF